MRAVSVTVMSSDPLSFPPLKMPLNELALVPGISVVLESSLLHAIGKASEPARAVRSQNRRLIMGYFFSEQARQRIPAHCCLTESEPAWAVINVCAGRFGSSLRTDPARMIFSQL